jgi:hypothetical protein
MESFSIASATKAVDELFKALPKRKQMDYLGELNEVLIILGRIPCKDKEKEYAPKPGK